MAARLSFKVAFAAAIGVLAYSVYPGAHAQGFTDEPTCYSWNGGHKSAGSFSKCNHWVATAPTAAPVVLAPLAAPPTVAPVMVPMQSCPPLPVPHRKPIVKRKPKVQC